MDEQLELIIDVQAKGILATTAEIKAAQDALDNLNREGALTEKVVDHVSTALAAQKKRLESAANQWKKLSTENVNARKELAAYQKQAEKDRNLAATQAAKGTDRMEGVLGRGAEAERSLDVTRSTRAAKDLAASWDAEFKALSRATDARKQMASEAEAGMARMVSATGKGADAERRLNAERSRGFQTSKQLQASWDAEFKALTRATDAQERHAQSINATRYANYDLANTLLRTSAVLTAAGIGAVVVGAQFERSFADVERTLQPGSYSIANLRKELTDLSREIPKSFAELSTIATLGNQLGIAGEDIIEFTRTVSQFSTITGMSVEETALAFGQLGNLLGVLPKDYDRLASAIALVGVNSAATETQIVSIAREIAPAARAAGLTAEQVIGLSGALGSIKVPPERSRSTILQFFEKLNTVAATGGEGLENFAKVVGVTAGELESMVRSGQGEEVLRRFIGTLDAKDTVEVTQALQALGLAGLRTNPTMRALADNVGLLNRAFGDSKQGWTENTELQRQYEIILDTLTEKWNLFVNGLMEFVAVIGSSVGPGLGVMLDGATDLLNVLADFGQSGFGQFLLQIGQGLLWAVAAWAAMRGAIALATGSALAFQAATQFLQGAGMKNAVLGLAGALNIYTPAAKGAAAGTWNLRAGLLALGKATVVVGLIQLLFTVLTDLKGAGDFVISMLVGLAQAVVATARVVSSFLGGLPGGGVFKDWANGLQDAHDSLDQFNKSAHQEWGNFARDMGWINDETKNVADSAEDIDFKPGLNPEIPDEFDKELQGVAKTVRTLTDYASDLASVWNRAFEIQFGPQQALDAITKQWIDIRKAADDSALAVRGYKTEINGLKNDQANLQYWLSVATKYKDEKRAAEIRAQMEENSQKLAEAEAKLREEKEKQNRTLTGNSEAAIRNRKTITDLVTSNLAYLQALAASGASSAFVKSEAERLRAELYNQGIELGYRRSDLDLYAEAFDGVKVAIDNVPKNITVEANVDPALQALNEFVAKAAQAGYDAGQTWGNNFGTGMAEGISLSERQAAFAATQLGSSLGAKLGDGIKSSFTSSTSSSSGSNRFSDPGIPGYAHPGNMAIDIGEWIRGLFGWADGGFTGRGARYQAAGIVHRGEYVIPKPLVNQSTGLPYADALGRLQRGAPGRSGYAGGGFVNPSTSSIAGMIASFGPMAEMQLRQAFQAILKMDSQVVATATGRVNSNSNTLGAS